MGDCGARGVGAVMKNVNIYDLTRDSDQRGAIKKMTPARFAEIGHKLYGHDWVSPLARGLRINRRTVQAIKNEGRDVPPVESDLAVLCEEKARELQAIAQMLKTGG